MPDSHAKPKVVILGGGIAALSAAFELTDRQDWRDRLESITVYQMGWRLGGKGASGRNAAVGDRIEEHGLHVWPGFYENAFDIMRRCYDELGRLPNTPLPRWDDAFKPHHVIVVTERIGGQWKHWSFEAPHKGGLPGDMTALPTLWDYIIGGLELMAGWFHQVAGIEEPALPNITAPVAGLLDRGLSLLEGGLGLIGLSGWGGGVRERRLGRLFRSAVSGAADLAEKTFIDVASRLARRLNLSTARARRDDQDLILWLVDHAMAWLSLQLGDLAAVSDTLRRLWIQLDFARTALRGIVDDRVLERGFDVLDGEDFLAWMRRHGASRITLESALLRGLHDFVFAYENADPLRPNLAAGVALRLILRLTFTYKGALMWKMQAGMGDVVFAPLYEVLRRRGVQFQFFHRVKELTLAADGQSVERIILGRQATPAPADYDPLVHVGGLPCWPNQPRYDKLVEGADLEARQINLESIWTDWADVQEVTLTEGGDFDVVLLGIPLAALRHTCTALIQARPAWKAMLDHVRTIKTQAAQLWFTDALPALGWALKSPILTAYQEPLETWADMSQTLPHENWPAGGQPGSVAYFCCTLPDEGPVPGPGPNPFPQQQAQAVHDATLAALGAHTRPLFPAACVPGTNGLDWARLHAPPGAAGTDRFEAQFWKANVEPSDRYVQSLAGTTQHRLAPGGSSFRNLYLAGDWTRNGLNLGCIEAAVISGRSAARAVLGDNRPVLGGED